ncbi:hypothetical protein OEZ85_003095 [Tetradesmus obliquus]|uniref:PsbP C-terminal domain-containing protein n=1 Tax=Tetradesmus obliquus TaxID=3088 RepID=A0ABY8TZM4_TETOB|nr:hypothetical protein OEZ85_003095 [Tetradesmus obliquus]
MLAARNTCRTANTAAARTPFRPFSAPRAAARCQAQRNQGPAFADAALCATVTAALLLTPGAAWAGRDKIGEFQASGFLFKDTVEVNALDDPEVPGVTIYFSDFKRSLVDKLQKDFFAEPSQASLTCSISPDATITNPANLGGAEGKEVFQEKKGLSIFKDKTLRVRRLYDPSRNTLVYVAYSTRLSTATDDGSVSTGRYRTSVCALKLPVAAAPVLAAAEAAAAAPV